MSRTDLPDPVADQLRRTVRRQRFAIAALALAGVGAVLMGQRSLQPNAPDRSWRATSVAVPSGGVAVVPAADGNWWVIDAQANATLARFNAPGGERELGLP